MAGRDKRFSLRQNFRRTAAHNRLHVQRAPADLSAEEKQLERGNVELTCI
jgi:hypothetical protein